MSKVYVGDIGTVIILECGISLSPATALAIEVLKPDLTTIEWMATKHTGETDTSLKYVTQEGDLDQSGTWELQAKVILPEWTGLGNTTKMKVYDKWS